MSASKLLNSTTSSFCATNDLLKAALSGPQQTILTNPLHPKAHILSICLSPRHGALTLNLMGFLRTFLDTVSISDPSLNSKDGKITL